MAKVILPREHDCGQKTAHALIVAVLSLIGGLGGMAIGSFLSRIMQDILHNSSIAVVYGFYFLPIIIGILVAFFYIRKQLDTKDHTICETCKKKMVPMTAMDSLFSIPARGDETYEDPMNYLAQNMVRISSVHDIPENGRGCYVCGYTCQTCGKHIVRIEDFYPDHNSFSCHWKESYYFDFGQFTAMRMKNDLL